MIRVTVELVSARTGKTSVLGVATITNDGTGGLDVGNYDVTLSKFRGKGTWKSGRVEQFRRVLLGPWDLLFRALAKTVGYRNRAESDEALRTAEDIE